MLTCIAINLIQLTFIVISLALTLLPSIQDYYNAAESEYEVVYYAYYL